MPPCSSPQPTKFPFSMVYQSPPLPAMSENSVDIGIESERDLSGDCWCASAARPDAWDGNSAPATAAASNRFVLPDLFM